MIQKGNSRFLRTSLSTSTLKTYAESSPGDSQFPLDHLGHLAGFLLLCEQRRDVGIEPLQGILRGGVGRLASHPPSVGLSWPWQLIWAPLG